MSTRSLLPGDASGGSTCKVGDPLAASKELISRMIMWEEGAVVDEK